MRRCSLVADRVLEKNHRVLKLTFSQNGSILRVWKGMKLQGSQTKTVFYWLFAGFGRE